MTGRRAARLLLAMLLVSPLAAACVSPEATRQRSGGAGADPGNRTAVVEMHEGSRPFHETPRRAAYGMTNLAGAQQAARLSRRQPSDAR
jgi:hypothetical protein